MNNMRYIKKIDDIVMEYSGVSLGDSSRYIGWLPYNGSLPLYRLDVVDNAIVELPEPPPPPTLVSKLALKRKLEKLGLWNNFKTSLETTGYWEDFVLANRLSTADEDFQSALSNISFACPDLDVDALLNECLWEA